MTAAQRTRLARLRVNHPRAVVAPLSVQTDAPMVSVKMKWPATTIVRWFWIAPDGELLSRREKVLQRPRARYR